MFRLNLRPAMCHRLAVGQHQPPREHLPQTSKAKIAWQRCFQLKITRANDVRPHSGETHDRPNLCIARHGDRRRSRSHPRRCSRRAAALRASRAALLGMDTLFPSLPNLQDKMMISQTSTHRELEALKQTCSQEYPKNAMHVQEAIGSRSSAIHDDYRTSLRTS